MNPLFKSVLSVPCPTCLAPAGQRCDMISKPEWITTGVLWHYHYARYENRPIGRTPSQRSTDRYHNLPEAKRLERDRKKLEAAKKKRRENNWRVA